MKSYPKQKNITLRKNAVLITFPKNLKYSSSKVVKTSLFILAKKIFSKILQFLMSHFHTKLAYGTLRKNIYDMINSDFLHYKVKFNLFNSAAFLRYETINCIILIVFEVNACIHLLIHFLSDVYKVYI